MPEEGPTGPKCCTKLWICVHSKIDLTIRPRTPSYNVTAQFLAKRSAVRDSDYHIHASREKKHHYSILFSSPSA